MNDNTMVVLLCALLTILILMFSGDPDMSDAIIRRLINSRAAETL